MSVLAAVQTVQYVTVRDKRFAVIAADEWEALVTWLETLEDLQIFKNAYGELAAAKGSREQAGWLAWADARHEIE